MPSWRCSSRSVRCSARWTLNAPLLTASGGCADWGPGNHGALQANQEGCFLKHVLGAHPKEKLPFDKVKAVVGVLRGGGGELALLKGPFVANHAAA